MRAGFVTSPNCQLCVRFGLCDPHDPEPRHRGTLLHRLWVCPVLEEQRQALVPAWLLAEVRRAVRADYTMEPADLLLYTRALAPSPAAALAPMPQGATFEWVVHPDSGGEYGAGKVYVDGSLLDSDWKLADCCARRGWAFAVANELGDVLASARGRPPSWAAGIHGAELWGLLMAAQTAMPGSAFRTDCLAVQTGTQRGLGWATAPERRLARAWGPLAVALEGHPDGVVWMPAHTTDAAVGSKR